MNYPREFEYIGAVTLSLAAVQHVYLWDPRITTSTRWDRLVCRVYERVGGHVMACRRNRYIYGSDAVIMVYDITSYQSFQDLNDWLHLVYGCSELLFRSCS